MLLQLFRKNSFFFLPFCLSAWILAYLLWSFSRDELFFWVNSHRLSFTDTFFCYFTDLGDGITVAIVALSTLWIRFRWTIFLGMSLLLTGEIAQILKHFVFPEAMRPSGTYLAGSFQTVTGLALHSQHSFPSGHTTSAFALACGLTLIAKNKRWGLLYFVLAAGVGYSRVYLAQHFVVDVFTGAILGVGVTVLIYVGLELYWRSHPKVWLNKHL